MNTNNAEPRLSARVGDTVLSSPLSVVLPNAPAIPGLRFRYFRNEADYAAMAEIYQIAMEADGLDFTATSEDIALWYRPDSHYDPFTQILFAEIDDRPVAFASIRHSREPNGNQIYTMFGLVLPAWRRQGLGRALLHHVERRACELARQQESSLQGYLRAWIASIVVGAVALAEQEGYSIVRHFFRMIRPTLEDIPQALLPEGIQVRPVLPSHYRATWEAEQEIFQGAWGFPVPGEEDYQSWLHNPHFDPSLWRVAWAGEQVAGLVRGLINQAENERHGRRRGFIESVGVRTPWRRQGLATALLCQSLQTLKTAGMNEAALFVDTDNPNQALHFYERCGFQVEQHMTVYEKPLTLTPE